ncbi:DUF2500 domain-containing protein [Peribacillus huizhouensis]|uniref:Uncharacterized protein n=1 Tax=Peribacillus huizhouensis TaxID=1501239 RepID=A0ABR6CLJ8_9BACI|nr:DUF2500 domain-containing protein [Peribacillus huizhouensis]MBA9025913.1 hypothetical protein [Peribacillus huizhouensis]
MIKGISTWSSNNDAPRLTVPAKVVAKRTSIHGEGEKRAYNHYYITFELIEGDFGDLHFQVTDISGLPEKGKTK